MTVAEIGMSTVSSESLVSVSTRNAFNAAGVWVRPATGPALPAAWVAVHAAARSIALRTLAARWRASHEPSLN